MRQLMLRVVDQQRTALHRGPFRVRGQHVHLVAAGLRAATEEADHHVGVVVSVVVGTGAAVYAGLFDLHAQGGRHRLRRAHPPGGIHRARFGRHGNLRRVRLARMHGGYGIRHLLAHPLLQVVQAFQIIEMLLQGLV